MARKSNTRAAQGAGSIRQRTDGTWEARITIGTNPGTGKPDRKSVYGKTQAEVRKKMTAIQRAVDNGTYQAPDKTTVSESLDEWMKTFCAVKVKPLTYSSYEVAIKNHIKPSIGALKMQAVKGVHVQKLYNGMTAAGSSAKTVKNVAAILHKAFSVAQKQGMIQVNPCDAAELPKATQKEIKPLTDAEIPLFLKAIDGHPMENAYALCLFAGLREGECLGLSWSQVDFEARRITISQQLQHEKKKGAAYYIAPGTKSGKPRQIEPPEIAFQYLRAERKRQAENRLAAGELWSNPDNLVFTDEMGGHLAISTFYKTFKRIAASIGRPDARPHDLRHTAATVAIASGADIKSVQDLLGHATASFTLNVYAHSSDQMKKDTAARMQSYYDNLTAKKA
ncbi:tyrosine-type recombinase/integrase [Dysosmobacter sp.]|uniref:tyrosine-type recombinase/integrase n=1 Tax=Dysosmobacter sp. TaxID=2591382 RepID=UPI002A8516B5|nr:site-specific integrase [Dysosmobacter sp.]MDY3984744.1 site-specific integrase [Dysosmobacter sp.]